MYFHRNRFQGSHLWGFRVLGPLDLGVSAGPRSPERQVKVRLTGNFLNSHSKITLLAWRICLAHISVETPIASWL